MSVVLVAVLLAATGDVRVLRDGPRRGGARLAAADRCRRE